MFLYNYFWTSMANPFFCSRCTTTIEERFFCWMDREVQRRGRGGCPGRGGHWLEVASQEATLHPSITDSHEGRPSSWTQTIFRMAAPRPLHLMCDLLPCHVVNFFLPLFMWVASSRAARRILETQTFDHKWEKKAPNSRGRLLLNQIRKAPATTWLKYHKYIWF